MVSLLFAFMAFNGEIITLVKHPFEFDSLETCEAHAREFMVQDRHPDFGTIVYECSIDEEKGTVS